MASRPEKDSNGSRVRNSRMEPTYNVPDYRANLIEEWCTYHPPPGDDQVKRYDAIRAQIKDAMHFIAEQTPKCDEQDDAMRWLRMAMMSANAAIACVECTAMSRGVDIRDRIPKAEWDAKYDRKMPNDDRQNMGSFPPEQDDRSERMQQPLAPGSKAMVTGNSDVPSEAPAQKPKEEPEPDTDGSGMNEAELEDAGIDPPPDKFDPPDRDDG